MLRGRLRVSATHRYKVVYCKHCIQVYREVRSQQDRDYIYNKMTEGGILCEKRALVLGDFMWIARKHTIEIVIDVIVERKRVSDLEESIKEGRYEGIHSTLVYIHVCRTEV